MGAGASSNGTGVHSVSVYGTALFDYALTIGLAVLVTAWTNVPLAITTIACLVLSMLAHAAFGVDTRTMRWIRGAKSAD